MVSHVMNLLIFLSLLAQLSKLFKLCDMLIFNFLQPLPVVGVSGVLLILAVLGG